MGPDKPIRGRDKFRYLDEDAHHPVKPVKESIKSTRMPSEGQSFKLFGYVFEIRKSSRTTIKAVCKNAKDQSELIKMKRGYKFKFMKTKFKITGCKIEPTRARLVAVAI